MRLHIPPVVATWLFSAQLAAATSESAKMAAAVTGARWWPFGDGFSLDWGGGEDPGASDADSLQALEPSRVQAPGDVIERDEALPAASVAAPLERRPRVALLRRSLVSDGTASDAMPVNAGYTNPDAPPARWNRMLARHGPPKPDPAALEEYDVEQSDEEKMAERRQARIVDQERLNRLSTMQAKQKASLAATKVGIISGYQKMYVQCLKFAGWVKAQGARGPALVRLWKGTCTPAIKARVATKNYASMCSAIGGAVSEFVDKPAWTPKMACEAVLRVFRASGIGANPLVE